MNTILLGFIAVSAITALAAQDWRKAIKVALVLVVIEGALRKWVLPQASQFIYFLKDFVVLGAYIRYFLLSPVQGKLLTQKKLILALIGLMFVWSIFQAFNPSLGSPIIGLFGIKNYFFYIPLIWLVPQLFQSEDEFYRFLRAYLLLIIPVGILAIAQFFSPPTSPLNVYAWGDEGPDVALAGLGTVRVTGTFSYLAGYSTYLLSCLCLLLPMLTRPQFKQWRILTIVELVLVVITAFMTGSRGLVIGAVLLIGGYITIQLAVDFSNFYRSIRKLILPGLVGFFAITQGAQLALESFWTRVNQANDSIPDRISNTFTQPFTNFQLKGLDGYGLGATFQANKIIRSTLQLPLGESIPVDYESEMGRIALEIGPLGFALWYGLRIILWVSLIQVYCKLTHPFLKQLALSVAIYQAVTFINQMVHNHTANFYHWFLYSFIFLLPQLEQAVQWQQTYSYVSTHRTPPNFSDSSHQ
ncbi:MAG: hypothetical protein F6K30_15080 [Cyanothece sp. SIO2G6]|nr:hypothetical protein [Cyanothece sp. SIO2G6]